MISLKFIHLPVADLGIYKGGFQFKKVEIYTDMRYAKVCTTLFGLVR